MSRLTKPVSPENQQAAAASTEITGKPKLSGDAVSEDYCKLYDAIKRLSGVREGHSRFGSGVAFFRGRREFAHFHGRQEIDIRLTTDGVARHRRLLAKVPNWCPNPYTDDWVIVRLRGCDVDKTLKLVRAAHERVR